MFAIGYRSATNGEYKNEQQSRTNRSRFTHVSYEPIQHDPPRGFALNEESRTQHGEPIIMYQTITITDFINAFDRADRSANFSNAGLVAIFDFLEDVNPDMELDVIGICCDFSEYKDLEELKQDYGYDEDLEEDDEILDYFRDQTIVLELANGGLVIQSY